jgi:Na+-translocating ferredoxin:NAD+ oxidoreductase subunit B
MALALMLILPAWVAGTLVVNTPLILLVIGLFFAIMLTIAHSKLKVDVDPRVAQVRDALPSANCGGCGFASCDQFAEAVVAGDVEPGGCVVISAAALKDIADILGVEASSAVPKRAIIHCGAHEHERLARAEYRGVPTCAEMNLVAGVQGCAYGCLGLGDCERACPFDAIEISRGLPIVDMVACTGCGSCVGACPRGIISLESMIEDPLVVIACSSRDAGKIVRTNCQVGCIACGLCAKQNADVFLIEHNLCRVQYVQKSYIGAEGLDRAVEKCPTVCLRRVGVSIADPHEMVDQRRRARAAKAAAVSGPQGRT